MPTPPVTSDERRRGVVYGTVYACISRRFTIILLEY